MLGTLPDDLATATAALVVAHPSHELRVHGWMQLARPRVLVLTDGSGRARDPRLAATTTVLREIGAAPGGLYGAITDLELYAALLRGDRGWFVALAERIAADLDGAAIDYVVRDAAEGYASAHDVGAMLVDAALALVARRTGRRIRSFEFLVVGVPALDAAAPEPGEVRLDLDDARFLRKVAAARRYHPALAAAIETALAGGPLQGVLRLSEPRLGATVDAQVVDLVMAAVTARPELHARVQDVLGGVPLAAFRCERLVPVPAGGGAAQAARAGTPFYEIYGEQLVAAGRYAEVIRWGDHVAPVAAALRRHVDDAVPRATACGS